jgi:hypothetical protein
MIIYNTLSSLDASQLIIVVLFAGISTAALYFVVRKIDYKGLLLSILLGIGLTLLSLLIGEGYYGGMLYHEKFGWPAQFYSVIRNIDPQELPALSMPFNQEFNPLKAIENFILYAAIAYMAIMIVESVRDKQLKAALAVSATLYLLIVSTACLSLLNNSKENIPEAEIEEAFDASFTEQEAKETLLAVHPDIGKGIQAGLPPQILYFTRQGQDWLIVHTTEGSGVDQIFEADCYQVKADGSVTVLGHYQYEPYMSYILQDINHLNVETCTIQE